MTGVPSQLDVHELLTAQDFVHRLARSLVFDQERVDDVVQEAWLAAVQRPPHPRAAVSWFRSTLLHLARRRARDDTRRRRREVAVTRSEELPSAADVLAREEQRREVVEAVLALPEPYRGVVLARFFDELEPREIARRRGMQAATVRSQLHRALEMLRQQLDERHGSRRAWGLSLLPLAKPGHTTGVGLITAAGALLMAKVLIGVGVMALVVFGFLSFDAGPVGPPPAHERQEIAAAARTAFEAPAAVSEASERVEVAKSLAAAAAPTAAGGLRGRVVYSDGRPAPNCLVRVLGIDGVSLFVDAPATGDQRTLSLPRGEARTGEDGVFTIAGLSPRTPYVVNADADGPDRTLRFCSVMPFPDATADLGDFVLEPKASFAGRAIDESGAPVAGAEVLAMDLPAALAAVLPFDRFVPAQGGMLWLPMPDAAAASDGGGYRELLHDYFASDLFMRADLDRREELGTIVVDRLPWLEAIWRELPIARTTTADDGSFVVRGVEPGGNMLIVRKPGLATGSKARVVATPGERKDVGDVLVPAGEELRGKVCSGDGNAVAGAEVRVGSFGALGCRGVAFCEEPVTTDQSGSFRTGGLGRGRVMVAARANARDAWQVIGPVATDEDVELQLPKQSALRLRVGRDDGAPVTGLAIEIYCGPDLRELRRAGLQTRLPARAPQQAGDGTWLFGDVPVGCYTLHVQADGVMPIDTMVVLPQQEPAPVTLRAATSVHVRVRDAAGQAIAGARIYVDPDDASTRTVMPTSYGMPRWTSLPLLAGLTDGEGELQVGIPAKGSWLKVTHPLHIARGVLVERGVTSAEVTLPEPGAITGRLFDHGAPADPRRWCVVAEPAMTMNVPLPHLRAGLQPDGSFAFPNVAPTEYRIHAAQVQPAALSLNRIVTSFEDLVMPRFFSDGPTSHRVTVAEGANATLEFDVDPSHPKPGEVPARLTGRAVVNGVPLAGAELMRRLDLFRYDMVATVAADGSFEVDSLRPGEHALHLVDTQAQVTVWECELTLQSGESRFLDLTMATGSLSGTAAFTCGLSSAGHVVTVTGSCNGGTAQRRVVIDVTGRFAFAALPAGDYLVAASGPDGKTEAVRVAIVAGAAAGPLRLDLQEVPVLSGRIVGDFNPSRALALLRAENWSRGNGIGDDGSFHFSDVPPEACTLELMVRGKTLKLEPGRFDMSLGSQRNVQVRVAETKPDK
ncbi:MAG TPA: sigma-70 family RNA polymerase sigma factor [Planctomycetota bacterium]